MNARQAKEEIDFPDLLSRLGFEPVKVTKGGRELWYRSPFRAEKEASFHTSYINGKWIWNDFGDTGGNIIDFVMRYEGLQTVREVLSYLRKLYPQGSRGYNPNQGSMFSFRKSNHKTADSWDGIEKQERQLELIEVHPIRNPVIYDYLEKERGIPRRLADRYLVEIKYWSKTKGKQFFAFGMKNESENGYELRVASSKYNFKSANKRDITLVPGRAGGANTVNVYEGMTDFMSHLVLTGTDHFDCDALIMHSLSSYNRSATCIRDRGYSKINLYLDNNASGQKTTARYTAEFGDLVINYSPSFAPHIDLNDALRAGHKLPPSRSNDPLLTP